MRKLSFFRWLVVGGWMCSSALFGYSGGDGSPSNPYQISTPQDWLTLCSTPADANGLCFILTSDINLSGFPISEVGTTEQPFTGSLDGAGHTIYGVNFQSAADFSGLFGTIGTEGLVQNLTVYNPVISGTSFHNFYIGGLAGYNKGTIRRCTVVRGSLTPEYIFISGGLVGGSEGLLLDCSYIGDTTLSGSYAGGLAGMNWGTMVSCKSQGNISINGTRGGHLAGGNSGRVFRCAASGSLTVSGTEGGGLIGINTGTVESSSADVNITLYPGSSKYAFIGGLIADNGGPVLNCCAKGNGTAYLLYGPSYTCRAGGLIGRSNPNILHCYSTGQVRGIPAPQTILGGLVGEKAGQGNIDEPYSFWDIQTSGCTVSAVGTGKTTAEMKMRSTFLAAGWDFTNETDNGPYETWRLCTDGIDYPRLNWQSRTGDRNCPPGVEKTDLAFLAEWWLADNCGFDNEFCAGTDLNYSQTVDGADWAIFTQNWLKNP
ncbi:MAG TPA: hypothetical protein PKY88_10280 [Anaerohalosphaeraceae bacterium]|nr:hypothetical protein [Anaerohalosphaeraceae bacterium]